VPNEPKIVSVEQSLALEPALWTLNFILLSLANLVLFMSTQMLIPTLPTYLFVVGGNEASVGYVMCAYTLCAMATRPVTGWLVDNYGRRPVLLIGMAMMVGASVLFQFAVNVPMIILIRGLHGLAFGITGTAVGTLLADSLPTARMNEGMGYFGLTTSLSLAIAPTLGFVLVSQFGYSQMFWSVAGLSGLAFVCGLPIKSKYQIEKGPNVIRPGIWESFLEKSAWNASVVMFFLAVVYASVISFVSLYAENLGISRNIGLFFTAVAIMMLISRPIGGRWADAGGTNMVIVIGFLTILAGMTTTGLAKNMAHLLLAGAFIGFGYGFCLPTLQTLAIIKSSPQRRGAATGTFFVAFDVGIGLGTVLWGFVATLTGYHIMFLTTLFPLVISAVTYYYYIFPKVE